MKKLTNWLKLDKDDSQLKKSIKDRAKYGVSDPDTWSFDSYLAKVIPNGIESIRDFGGCVRLCGWCEAVDDECVYAAILTAIMDGFTSYAKNQYKGEEDLYDGEFELGMELFVEFFPSLWT